MPSNSTMPSDINRVVEVLKQVPEKRLMLIDLVNQVGTKYGELDYSKLDAIQPQLNLALVEAQAYSQATSNCVDALLRMASKGD